MATAEAPKNSSDPIDTTLSQRADAAQANMGSALMVGIALAIIATIMLFVTKLS